MSDTQPRSNGKLWLDLTTTLTVGLFVVAGVSGVMMFLGVGKMLLKEAHELLGLAFVVAGVLHGVRHWRAMWRYLGSKVLWGSVAVVGAATLALTLPEAGGGGGGPRGNPMRQTVEVVASSHLDDLAPLLNTKTDALVGKLQAVGISANGPEDTLKQIEQRSGRALPELLAVVLSN